MLRDVILSATTNSSGDKTLKYSDQVAGLLIGIEWVVGTFDAGVDAVITLQDSPSGVARTLLTLTNANSNAFYNVREAEHDNTGTATTTGSTCYPLIVGKPQVVVSSGGNAKTGKVILYYLPL
jgi:hypothetical protein